MQLAEIKAIFHKELSEIYPKEEIDNFFYQTIEHFLKLERFVLVMQTNYAITKEEEQPLFEALARLKKEEPLQYILEEAHFMDLILKVNRHTLIPRPETEELVQWIINDCQVERSRDLKVLDIGTGSGCIAIALAKYLPNAQVFALDISEEALQIAKKNAELNDVSIEFIKANILNVSTTLSTDFDIIVSNPPYVREQEKIEIHNNVKEYEPSLALFVPNNNPLVFYKAIGEFTNTYLKEKGSLYLEINQYLGLETKSLFQHLNFSKIELKKDIFENDRMIKCQK